MIKKNANQNQKGFTLPELLISVVIALLILLLVSTTFVLNQRVFKKSNTKAELIQNSRIVLDLMAREIRQAKKIITILPADDSNPANVPHELQFEDGHVESHIQYIRYYLAGTDLKRQVIVYYFETDPQTYVYVDDFDAFGPPEQNILDDKIIGENFSGLNFFGGENITVELNLEKAAENVNIETIINPRNI